MFKVAIITPKEHSDYLVSDVVDGVLDLVSSGVQIECRFPKGYPHHFGLEGDVCELEKKDFIEYARDADIIFFGYRYKDADIDLAKKIDQWHKTVFIDGSECKHDKRFDPRIQHDILTDSYDGPGKIQYEMLSKCTLYLRREKPYISGIMPFPFGIQRRYRVYTPDTHKDIDFVCIFGQDTYPELRTYVKKTLQEFCVKNGFSCVTSHTKGFGYDSTKEAGREDFYQTLARARVGISIGGGGFDTLRFWETLANNCLLITERIDIFPPNSQALSYNRIFECNNLYDFMFYFEKLGAFLKAGYQQSALEEEYQQILTQHSTKQRVTEVLFELHTRGAIETLPSGLGVERN